MAKNAASASPSSRTDEVQVEAERQDGDEQDESTAPAPGRSPSAPARPSATCATAGVTSSRSCEPVWISPSRLEPVIEVPMKQVITMMPGTKDCSATSVGWPLTPASSGPNSARKTSGWTRLKTTVNGSRTRGPQLADEHGPGVGGRASGLLGGGRRRALSRRLRPVRDRKTSSSVGRSASAAETATPAAASAAAGGAAAPARPATRRVTWRPSTVTRLARRAADRLDAAPGSSTLQHDAVAERRLEPVARCRRRSPDRGP